MLAMVVAVAAGAMARAQSGVLRDFGSVALFHIAAPLPDPLPAGGLAQVDFANFTYVLYPTADSWLGGGIGGQAAKGTPIRLTLQDGSVSRQGDQPGAQLIKSEMIPLPKAPGREGRLIFAVLYPAHHRNACTGLVDLIQVVNGHLVATDQITYDCRGGAPIRYNKKKHRLEVASSRYSAGDDLCCPSLADKVDFKFDGRRVKAQNIRLAQ